MSPVRTVVAWNARAKSDIATHVPYAVRAACRVGKATSTAFGFCLVARGISEQRIIPEDDRTDVVRATSRLDDVHVHVLRSVALWIVPGPDGDESVSPDRVSHRPAAKLAMTPS